MIQVKETDDYLDWLSSLTRKKQAMVKARISRIEQNEYFGTARNLGDGLAELKWTNGWRVYFINAGNKTIILINGGHKNGQEKDIKKARIFIRRIAAH